MDAETREPRLLILDVARGVALVAMAIYHFGWDLFFFGYVSSEAVNQGPWKIFARCIASSFLILVGIGLVLAHLDGIRWRGFAWRWLKIAAAALIISIATFFFVREGFIFFGILHQIAFASLAGLLLLRFPAIILLVLGVIWVLAAPYLKTDIFNSLHLAWTGLQTEGVVSNDYVPVFPWFGAVIVGMGLSKLALQYNFFERIDVLPVNRMTNVLSFLGRHSLLTYLLHQPVLIGMVYLFSLIYPAQIDAASLQRQFDHSCQQSCGLEQSAENCVFYCDCVRTELQQEELFTPVMNGAVDFATGKPAEISQQCSVEMIRNAVERP